MAGIRIKFIHFLKIIRIFLMVSGVFFLAILILAATSLPYRGIHWLGTSLSSHNRKPGTIILMGGGGMPSESTLMRCWYTVRVAENFPDARIFIAMPGDLNDSLSTPSLIASELIKKGIAPGRIFFESTGKNTRYQAQECARLIGITDSVLMVTSPEHMRRAILCFEKVGFRKVDGLPTFENVIETDMKFDDDKLGGNRLLIPDVGGNISVRYRIWTHLQYEIRIAREFTALLFYKMRGWI